MSTHWPANATRGGIATAAARARRRLFNMRTSLRSDALVGCVPLLKNFRIVLSHRLTLHRSREPTVTSLNKNYAKLGRARMGCCVCALLARLANLVVCAGDRDASALIPLTGEVEIGQPMIDGLSPFGVPLRDVAQELELRGPLAHERFGAGLRHYGTRSVCR